MINQAKKPKKPNLVHELFAKHLTELRLEFSSEVQVAENRQWRWDFTFYANNMIYAVEIDGFFKGRHAGWGADYEKQNIGVILGWNPLRFTTTEVNTGKAKGFIAEHILGRENIYSERAAQGRAKAFLKEHLK
jgi:very-short-patch-repair endonuclease